MENLYIFSFFVVFMGRIIKENDFVVKKYKYYREMFIFFIYDDNYKRYVRWFYYRVFFFIIR